MSLTRARIVDSALRILAEFGLADLSMRRIAASLGVQPGALYWHIANKQSLLAAVADGLLADLEPPAGPERDHLRVYAGSLRTRLLAHRDGAEVVSSVLAMRLPARSPVAELGAVLRTVWAGERADAAAALIVHFVLGHCLDCQGYAQAAALGVAETTEEDFEARFDAGLEILLNGLNALSD